MSIGVKGFQYRGWVVRYGWSAAKGCNTYTASNPDHRGQAQTFTRPTEVERWIDKQPQVKPVAQGPKRNRYAQQCQRCGRYVEAQAGRLLTWDEAERAGLKLPRRPQYIVVHDACLEVSK